MTRAGTGFCSLTRQETDKLRAAISAGPVRPFLVTGDRSGGRLTFHVAREAAKASAKVSPLAGIGFRYAIERNFSRQASALGLDRSIRIKLHSRGALEKPRSLEAFVARFGPGERLYDPTSVFDEAEQLVVFGGEIRRRLQDDLKGIYWSARWRMIHVLLNEEAFVGVDGYCLRQDKLIATERSVIDAHDAVAEAGVSHNVRLCFRLSGGSLLVPIDDASVGLEQTRERPISALLRLATLARIPVLSAALGIGSAGVAAAKLLPSESRAALTRADTAPTVAKPYYRRAAIQTENRVEPGSLRGGPALLSLSRNPIQDPAGRNTSPEYPSPRASFSSLTANDAIGDDGRVSRDHFFEVSRSGSTFDAPSAKMAKRRLDLRWSPDDERAERAELNASGRQVATYPAMQSGVAGIPGLSRLMEDDLSNETYGVVLKDIQAHFGLPRSLQTEALLHFANSADSVQSSERSKGFFQRKVLLAEAESYFEWLQRIGPRNPSRDGRDYRGYPNGAVPGPGGGGHRSSSSR